MNGFRAFAALALTALPLCAHDVSTQVTWAREVSRFVAKHCASCHKDGGKAFPLTTYEQAKPKAAAMAKAVRERRMPPAGIVKGFGDFKDDASLTQEQIEVITSWVETGAQEGDRSLLAKDAGSAGAATEPEPKGTEFPVDGTRKLDAAMTFAGIAPKSIKGESVQVTALKPNGEIEPLVWFYRFDQRFGHTYWFRKPVSLPAGSKIVAAGGSSVALIAQPPAH